MLSGKRDSDGLTTGRVHVNVFIAVLEIYMQICMISFLSRPQVGIVVAGGYYNGLSTMFYPLNNNYNKEWEWMGNLPSERKWGPALGIVNGVLTIAGNIRSILM